MSGTATDTTTVRVYEVYIKATPEAIWDAVTKPEWAAKYGYGGIVELDPRVGGAYKAGATEEMQGYGMPAELIVGEVLEWDPPRKFVQTWHPIWSDDIAAEPVTTVTYEIKASENGVSRLTLSHDVTGAPLAEAQISGAIENAGGGWPYVLSDIKSLLETGKALGS